MTAKIKAGWKTYKLSCKVTVKKKAGTTVVPPANTQGPAVVNPGDSSSAVKTATGLVLSMQTVCRAARSRAYS